jgi:hypothetical protein
MMNIKLSTLIVFLTFLLFVSCDEDDRPTNSELRIEVVWEKSYGGDDHEQANAIVATDDGNFLVAGYISPAAGGGSDVYLMKIDIDGDTLWTRTIPGSYSENAWELIKTDDGGFVVGGSPYMGTPGDFNFYLAKVDGGGNLLWQNYYGDENNQSFQSVVQADDGGFLLTGLISDPDHLSSDVLLIKTNSSGDSLWAETYDSYFNYNSDDGRIILSTEDNYYYIIGVADSGFGTEDHLYFLYVDSAGGTVLEKTIDLQYDYFISSAILSPNDKIIVSGWGSDLSGNAGMFVTQLHRNGTIEWEHFYGSSHSGGGGAVAATYDGGYIITGFLAKLPMGSDCLTVKIDNSGNEQWRQMSGMGVSARGQDIIQAADGRYIVVGHTYPEGGDDPQADIYLTRIDVIHGFR